MIGSSHQGKEPTWVVETTADLHSSQLAVKPDRAWGVGGNFAGILLSTLTAPICKESNNVSTLK